MATIEELSPRVGLLGELEVEMQIIHQGWHPVRLDTAQMASNADILAVNRQRRVSIQVKTTDASKQRVKSRVAEVAERLNFGYSTGYLSDGKSIFNSKNSPLIADMVIAVSYSPHKSRFIVMPVGFAETLCRLHCDFWNSVPTKSAKAQRSRTFPIYLPFAANRQMHREHFDRLKRNVLRFENEWSVLSEDVDSLHDPNRWPLLD